MNDLTLLTVMGDNLYLIRIIDVIGCLIFSFIGSLLKEIYNTNNIENYEYAPYKVICSTVVGSIASMVFRAHYFSDCTAPESALITFVFGLLGFEIFKDLSTIEGIKRLIGKFREITGILFGGRIETTANDSNTNEIEKEPEVKHKGKFHGSIRGVPVTPKINVHKKDK